jgi:peptidoglycan-associated lipoprotein
MKKVILLSILSIIINLQLIADNCVKTSEKISFGVVSVAQASVIGGPVGAFWGLGVLTYLSNYQNPASCYDYTSKTVKKVYQPKKIKKVTKVKPAIKSSKINQVAKVKQIKQIKKSIKQIKKQPIKIKKIEKPIKHTNKYNHGDKVYKNFISFDYDSYDVNTYPSILNNLSNNKIKSIRIEGNTDEYGSNKYNKILGLVRAMVVKEILIENNIDKNKLSIVSNGSTNPISNNDLENRRVDLVITYYNTNTVKKAKKYTKPQRTYNNLSTSQKIYTNFVNFKYTSYEIDTYPSLLDNLSNNKIKSIRIEGNTDKFGTSNYNERLGQNRANAVKELLIKNNIDSNKLSIASNASRNPISDNNANNRRVDLIVTYYKRNIQNNNRSSISKRKIYNSKEKLYTNFVNFKYDSYDIDSFPSLLDNLSNNKIKSIRIEGNTDNYGTSEYNKILGLNRAMAVKELLIENNIDEFKLSIVSYGNKNLISNDDAKNRRVDLIITYYK